MEFVSQSVSLQHPEVEEAQCRHMRSATVPTAELLILEQMPPDTGGCHPVRDDRVDFSA